MCSYIISSPVPLRGDYERLIQVSLGSLSVSTGAGLTIIAECRRLSLRRRFSHGEPFCSIVDRCDIHVMMTHAHEIFRETEQSYTEYSLTKFVLTNIMNRDYLLVDRAK
jgi:ADP-glucose pyrophosphorylase